MKMALQSNASRYTEAIDTLLTYVEIAPEDKLFNVYATIANIYSYMDGDFTSQQVEYLQKALAQDLPDPNEDRPYYAARLCRLAGESCEEEQSDD
jgi:hypothetical protein